MENIKCVNSFYLKDAVAPQTFFINDEVVYYFDKTNKYEGRFCVNDNCKGSIISEIGDGYGLFDSNGNMYIININMESNITLYSSRNSRTADFQLEGIFYDLKVDENGNYIFLGNNNGKTIIKLLDKNYNEKGTIKPQGVIFGSSIYIFGENIFLGAVGENDKLKILKINYIGGLIENYNINVKYKNRIISKMAMLENYIIALISGNKESIVIFDLFSGRTDEIFPYQLGLNTITDMCIKENNIYFLCGRRIIKFEFNELRYRKKPEIFLANSNSGIGLYMKIMYSVELFECIKKYLYISLFMAFMELIILYIYNIVKPYRIFGSILLITLFTFIFNCFIGMFVSVLKLSSKNNRIEKLLCILYEEYSTFGIYAASLFNAIAADVVLYITIYSPIIKKLYVLIGIIIFLADTYTNNTARKKIKILKGEVIIELLEDDDLQVKKYIKNLSEEMNGSNISLLKINIVSDKNIDESIAALWHKSRKFIIKNDISCTVNQNKMTAVLDLSCRDIRYSKYNIIMDFVCYMRLKTRIKELKIEIIGSKPV